MRLSWTITRSLSLSKELRWMASFVSIHQTSLLMYTVSPLNSLILFADIFSHPPLLLRNRFRRTHRSPASLIASRISRSNQLQQNQVSNFRIRIRVNLNKASIQRAQKEVCFQSRNWKSRSRGIGQTPNESIYKSRIFFFNQPSKKR